MRGMGGGSGGLVGLVEFQVFAAEAVAQQRRILAAREHGFQVVDDRHRYSLGGLGLTPSCLSLRYRCVRSVPDMRATSATLPPVRLR